MPEKTIDADMILPIVLSENACREGVESLNQLLADTITLRDLYKKHHWQVAGQTFYPMPSRSAFSCSVA